jgi:Protein of unknown function (DUF3631)
MGGMDGGKPLTKTGLARLLAPFEIYPDQIRILDVAKKGYLAVQFAEAFEIYLYGEEGV